MEKEFIDKIRNCSKIKGKQKTWISELSDRQLVKLFLMVKRGQSAKSIAREIQIKWGVRKRSNIHSLSQAVLKFKQRTSDLSDPLHLKHSKAPSFNKAEYQPTDNLEQNEKIASDLRQRIDRLMKEERELGLSYPNLSRDLQAFVALEKTILKQKEHLIRYQNRDPLQKIKKIDEQVEMNVLFKNLVRQIAFTPSEKQKFVESTKRFVELLHEESIDVELDEDGNLRKI
jgi:hypothetical protein